MGNITICNLNNDFENDSNFREVQYHFDSRKSHVNLVINHSILEQIDEIDIMKQNVRSSLVLPKLPTNQCSQFTLKIQNPEGVKIGIAHYSQVEQYNYEYNYFLECKDHGLYVVSGEGKYYKNRKFGSQEIDEFQFNEEDQIISVKWDPIKQIVCWKYRQEKRRSMSLLSEGKLQISDLSQSMESIRRKSCFVREGTFQMDVKSSVLNQFDLYGIIILGSHKNKVEILQNQSLFEESEN